jgi:hypothetical protein
MLKRSNEYHVVAIAADGRYGVVEMLAHIASRGTPQTAISTATTPIANRYVQAFDHVHTARLQMQVV